MVEFTTEQKARAIQAKPYTMPPGEGNPWGVQTVTPQAGTEAWTIKSVEPLAPGPPAPAATQPQMGAPEPPAEQPQSSLSPWIAKAIEPITSYPETYQKMQTESRQQISEGAKQFGEGEKLKGAFNVGVGALGYATSPISAAVRTVVGKPVEEATGIPKEYTEFATTLALPYIGFGKVPKTLEKIVSPETVSPIAGEAAAIIRQNTGLSARATEQFAAQVEPFQKLVNTLPQADQLSLINYIERVPGAAVPPTPQLRAFADTLRGAFEARKAQLQQLGPTATANFIEDYFPHFWKDPTGAPATGMPTGGKGVYKQGSGASLKARSIPTVQEGINAGLTPLTTNPIEAAARYITSIDKFIASQRILEAAKDSGTIQYIKPRVVGASGHPESLRVPPGYAPLEGRGATRADGAKAYAPEDWARVYNNFISRGFEQIGGGEYGSVYNALRYGANMITQMVLSFSGYHAFTMAEAGASSQIAKAVASIRKGEPGSAMKEFGKAYVSPVSYAVRGKKYEDMYLHPNMPISPQDREIINLITEAGGRMSGRSKHMLDYEASALGSYMRSFRRGKLLGEVKGQAADIKAHPVAGTARTVASNMGRIMDTFNQPLFQHYIPAMKNAAAYENLAQWLAHNPGATAAEKLAAARKVVDSVDNRFGEMIHDNIFWHKVAKQTAMLSLLSYSWNMGGVREIGGGVRDIGRTVVRGTPWTAKADYVMGMTINWGIMSAVYQFMKTGEAPRDIRDLAAPRTGGIDSRTGEPERIIPPGIMKDVFGYYEHFGQEVLNKVNPAAKIAGQSMSILAGQGGSDWRGDPILAPPDHEKATAQQAAEWMAQYFNFVLKGMRPIQMQNLGRGAEVGSNLTAPELMLGIRTAPRQFVAPERVEGVKQKYWQRRWKGKMRHDVQEEQRYGGPVE